MSSFWMDVSMYCSRSAMSRRRSASDDRSCASSGVWAMVVMVSNHLKDDSFESNGLSWGSADEEAVGEAPAGVGAGPEGGGGLDRFSVHAHFLAFS